VVLVGSDNIILGDSVILSDDSPKTLPVKDLTTNTVRINVDQKKANDKRSPIKKLQDKFTRQEQGEEWFKISDISFHTVLLKTLEVCLSLIFSVKNGSGLPWLDLLQVLKMPQKITP
jgi:hypothetical protein